MRILILGGDGYLGWPTAMHLSARGHDVTVVDNYFRRHACDAIDVGMLYRTPTLVERAKRWHERTGREVKVVIGDLAEPRFTRDLFCGRVAHQWPLEPSEQRQFEAIVHYAEQPSAPYSQLSHLHAHQTLTNNLAVTNNVMFSVKEFCPDAHIVKLGTMGEYGTPNIDIEEGWLEVEHKGRSDTFLFPRQASSLYHTTKVMDTDLLWFGVRTWNLRVTDLMQGPVYGIETDENEGQEDLYPIFNYDEVFGTVVNRFIVQAIAGYPLTVYGAGGQTRGYLNIRDTLQCIEKALMSPAEKRELRIFNQIMETFSVRELAEQTQRVGQSLGYEVKVDTIDNPRKEAEEHYYNPTYQGLLGLGVEPHYLTDDVMRGMFDVVKRYGHNIRNDVIFRGVRW